MSATSVAVPATPVATYRDKLSDAEWAIMHALWAHSPASARDVLTHLPAGIDWAYTTVKTMLDRLVEKGLVAVQKQANAGVYRPLLTREAARSSALRSLVERAFGGAFDSLVQHFVQQERLSPRDRQKLKALLDEAAARPKDAP